MGETFPEQLVRKMYTTYCAAVGGKAFNGNTLPDWDTFRADPAKQVQANAWIEAAKAAVLSVRDHLQEEFTELARQ